MTKVICSKCGTNKDIDKPIYADNYFPNLIVRVIETGNYLTCGNCHDNGCMTIFGEAYIDLLGKSNIIGIDKELIRYSNTLYLNKELFSVKLDLSIEESKENTNSFKVRTINLKINYLETSMAINTKV